MELCRLWQLPVILFLLVQPLSGTGRCYGSDQSSAEHKPPVNSVQSGNVSVPLPQTGIPHHLLAMPWNVAYNQCQPVKRSEALGRVAIFRAIVDGAALLKVSHPLLRELAADDVMSKTLQGITIICRYRLANMDVEAAVVPRHQQINVPLADGSLTDSIFLKLK